MILIVLDAASPMKHKQIIENELEGFGIRLNKKPPKIKVQRVDKGGIGIIRNTEKLEYLNDDLVSLKITTSKTNSILDQSYLQRIQVGEC